MEVVSELNLLCTQSPIRGRGFSNDKLNGANNGWSVFLYLDYREWIVEGKQYCLSCCGQPEDRGQLSLPPTKIGLIETQRCGLSLS